MAKVVGMYAAKPVELSDVICPVCLCILIEPVTMPCTHELCLPCFKQNVNKANLQCPVCRQRISSWARRAARENTLVNQTRWVMIRKTFPDKIAQRLNDNGDDDDVGLKVNVPAICQPGELRKEYEEFVNRAMQEEAEMREIEVKQSEQLIKSIQEKEREEEMQRKIMADRDFAIARLLAQRIIQVPTSEEDVTVDETLRNIDSLMRPSSSDACCTGLGESRGERESKRRRRSSCSGAICKSVFTGGDLSSEPRDPSAFQKKVEDTDQDDTGKKTSDNDDNRDDDDDDDTSSLETVDLPRGRTDLIKACSVAIDSDDSITEELRHFRPIRIEPRTPPRCRPDGRLEEVPKIVHTVPTNLLMQLDLSEHGPGPAAADRQVCILNRLVRLVTERRTKVSLASQAAKAGGYPTKENKGRPPKTLRVLLTRSRRLKQPLTSVHQPATNVADVGVACHKAPHGKRSTLEERCVQANAPEKRKIRQILSYRVGRKLADCSDGNMENSARASVKSRKTSRRRSHRRLSRRCLRNQQQKAAAAVPAAKFNMRRGVLGRMPAKERTNVAVKVAVDAARSAKNIESDRLYALQLHRKIQRQLQRAACCIDRRKGTTGEYNLRSRKGRV